MNMFVKIKTVFLISCLTLACLSTIATENVCDSCSVTSPLNYPDVLTIGNNIVSNKDSNTSNFGFTDLGAWHGYAMGSNTPADDLAAFGSPLIINERSSGWLGQKFMALALSENNNAVDFKKAANVKAVYYPGMLTKSFSVEKLKIEMKAVFISDRTSLTQIRITNHSDRQRTLKVNFESSFFKKPKQIKTQGNELVFKCFRSCIAIVSLPYSFELKNRAELLQLKDEFNIAPEGTLEIPFTVSVYPKGDKLKTEKPVRAAFWKNSSKSSELITAALKRWEKYFSRIMPRVKGGDAERRLAAKCVITLVNNTRSPAYKYKYDSAYPSLQTKHFNRIWAWDTWKQAAAMACYDPEAAKQSVRSMYEYQQKNGMVIDCMGPGGQFNNQKSKPPLSAWCVWKIYQLDNDLKFLQELYPKIVKYHNWWYKERDYNSNGICEWGGTKRRLILPKWESGMDNAVRFDRIKLAKINDHAWTFKLESVDLNSFLFAEKLYLANIAEVIGRKADALKYREEAARLKKIIQTKFYDPQSGFFYDWDTVKQQLQSKKGPEGWAPLWTNAATREQAKAVRDAIYNPKTFMTYVPLPTCSADAEGFNPDDSYWRGSIWVDQVYFGAEGLRNYAFITEADKVRDQFLKNADGVLNSNKPIRENYHPLTGKGLRAKGFGWSSAHILMWLVD